MSIPDQKLFQAAGEKKQYVNFTNLYLGLSKKYSPSIVYQDLTPQIRCYSISNTIEGVRYLDQHERFQYYCKDKKRWINILQIESTHLHSDKQMKILHLISLAEFNGQQYVPRKEILQISGPLNTTFQQLCAKYKFLPQIIK